MAASYFLMFSQKSSTLSVDLSEKNKGESKIIRMLPDKKTSLLFVCTEIQQIQQSLKNKQ